MVSTALKLLAVCLLALLGQEVKAQSELENGIVSEINRIRSDPAAYAHWMEKNISALPLASTRVQQSTIREAIAELRKTPALPELKYASGIYQAAADHVKDQIVKGLPFSHMGTDGTNPIGRMRRYGTFTFPGYENGSVMHTDAAQSIVLAWVIDESAEERLHREAILHPKLLFAAAACGVYAPSGKVVGATLCVACFAAQYQDNPQSVPAR